MEEVVIYVGGILWWLIAFTLFATIVGLTMAALSIFTN